MEDRVRLLALVFVLMASPAFAQWPQPDPPVNSQPQPIPSYPLNPNVGPRDRQNFIPPVRRIPEAHAGTDTNDPRATNPRFILPHIEPNMGRPTQREVAEGQRCAGARMLYRQTRARLQRTVNVNLLSAGGTLSRDEASAIINRMDLEPMALENEAKYAMERNMFDRCAELYSAATTTITGIVDHALGRPSRNP